LANVDRFSKFFDQVIRKKILYVHIRKISTLPDLVKVENPKMLPNFHVERGN